jgi:hypothetical protein
LINVAGESRVRITIVEDVAAGTNTTRIILLAATKRKDPKSIWQRRSEGPYLKEFNLPTPPLTPGGKISSSIEGPEITYYRRCHLH